MRFRNADTTPDGCSWLALVVLKYQMKPRKPAKDEDAIVAAVDPPAETPEAPPESTLDHSRPSTVKLLAVGVVALLVVGTLGFASTQNAFGVPPATVAPPPVATQPAAGATAPPQPATNPPFMGSTQGCDAAFWATPDHFPDWEEYTPDQPVGSIFGHAGTYATISLADALGNQTSGEDARRTLLREAVAAALNAANDSLAFPYTRYDTGVDGRPPLVPTTNRLLTSGTDAEIVQFTNDLSQANALGCPL